MTDMQDLNGTLGLSIINEPSIQKFEAHYHIEDILIKSSPCKYQEIL